MPERDRQPQRAPVAVDPDAEHPQGGTAAEPLLDAPEHGEIATRVRWNQVFTGLFGDPPAPVEIGRFSLSQCIGVGGMGELYAAHDSQLDREVAIKLVRSTGTDHALAEERLLREAKILARISHPNVVPVYEAGVFAGRVFMAMEFVRGTTLTEWLESPPEGQERREVPAILRRFIAAGRGLEAVHASGLAHRDFKPDNVLIGKDGRVRIVDFGLARSVVGDAEPEPSGASPIGAPALVPSPIDSRLTVTGTLLGTPRYMAPEQWQGERGDSKSDQFSFCVALHEALYGAPPFVGDTMVELAAAVVQGVQTPPPAGIDIPAPVRRALARGLAAEPDARFDSIGELLGALEQGLQKPRRRGWMVAVAIAAAAAAVALILALRGSPTAEDPAETARSRETRAKERLQAVEQRVAELSAAGRFDDADQAFRTFASLRENEDTAALAEGWLRHADSLRQREQHEAETTAHANAYVLATTDDQQARALLGLARVFRRTDQWSRLRAIVDPLPGASTALIRTPELAAMRIEEAMARHDLAAAVAELNAADATSADAPVSPEVASAVRALAQVTRTDNPTAGHLSRLSGMRQLPGLDLDGDGRGELLAQLSRPAHPVLLGAGDASLPRLQQLELPGGPADHIFGLPAAPGQPQLFIGQRRDQLTLYQLTSAADRTRADPVHQWREPRLLRTDASAVGDLDGDGQPEVLVGYHGRPNRLLALQRADNGTWRTFAPHPPTDEAHSSIVHLAIEDLDGDGRDELVVLASEWWAYDVRILGADSAGIEPLTLRARRKLGSLTGFSLVPMPSLGEVWIAVGVQHSYRSRRVFPAEALGGEPVGIYLLAYRGGALEVVHHLPQTGRGDKVFRIASGDIDGDGRTDLAVDVGRDAGTLLYLQTAAGDFTRLFLGGLWVWTALQLDDDPADELVVSPARDARPGSATLAVLGAGTDALPTPDETRVAPGVAPTDIDPAIARVWQRAEDLAAIGLAVRAADALERVVTVADASAARASLIRASELQESAGAWLRAAQLAEQAAMRTELTGAQANASRAALERAVALYERVYRFADALRLARQLLAHPGLPAAERASASTRVDRLRALARPVSPLTFTFDDGLQAPWRIEHPLGLRSGADALSVDALTVPGHPVLARLPVIWDGGVLSLEVELDLVSAQWGSGLYIGLAAPGASEPGPVRVGFQAWGGGGVYRRTFDCEHQRHLAQAPDTLLIPHPDVVLPADEQRYVLRVDVAPERKEKWCTVTGVRDDWYEPISLTAENLAPGRYDLLIVAAGVGFDSPVHATARIHRIEVTGVRHVENADDESLEHQLYRHMANGERARAARLLERPVTELTPQATGVLRYLVLDDLGRSAEAEASLRRALGARGARGFAPRCVEGQKDSGLLRSLLRLRPERVAPVLRRACRPGAYFESIWHAWQSTIYQHPDEEVAHRMLTSQLAGLENHRPSPDERFVVMRLLRARARAWAGQGVLGAARADLQRAIAEGESVAGEQSAQRVRNGHAMSHELAHAQRALAGVLFTMGDADGAIRQIRQALARTATPGILADMMRAQEDLRGLHQHPDWHRLVDAARAGKPIAE